MSYSLVWIPQKENGLLQKLGVKGITGYIPCLNANGENEDGLQGTFDIINIACASLLALSSSRPVPVVGHFPVEKVRSLFEQLKKIGPKQYDTDNGIEDLILQFAANMVKEYGNLAVSDILYNGLEIEPESKKITHDCIVHMLLAIEHEEVGVKHCAERIVSLQPGPLDENRLNRFRNETWHYFYYLSVAYLQGVSAIEGLYMVGITHPLLNDNLCKVMEGEKKPEELFNFTEMIGKVTQ